MSDNHFFDVRSALLSAINLHGAGRFADVEKACKDILVRVPEQSDALNLLGAIACEVGEHGRGAEWFRRAVAANGRIAQYHHNLGQALTDSGDAKAAAESFRRVLTLEPNHLDARTALAGALLRQGTAGEAVQIYLDVVRRAPQSASAHYGLGAALFEVGDAHRSLVACDAATRIDPSFAPAHVGRGNALSKLSRDDEALAAWQRAAELDSALPEPHLNACVLLTRRKAYDEAIRAGRRTVELAPGLAEAHFVLGVALADNGNDDEAVAAYRRVIAAASDHAMAHTNLGRLLGRSGDGAAAESCLSKALELEPGQPEALLNLGCLRLAAQRYQEAESLFAQALASRPNYGEASHNLAIVLVRTGRLEAAEALARQAVALLAEAPEPRWCLALVAFEGGRANEAVAILDGVLERVPDHLPSLRALAFMLNSSEGVDPKRILDTHRRYAKYLEASLPPRQPPIFTNPQGARLRIGYLSPDLCNHSVAHFIEPILAAHDRSGFEVFCYQLNAKSDEITARLKPLAEHWRDISALDDDAVAAKFRADRIDILIDLAGNTDGNFAPVLIAKPAPVQITYLGYPTSLGIASVDYRLTDWQVDPEGYEAYSSERLLRMPSSYFCFHAREAPPLLPPPKARSGHIAFGSFNSLNKLSAATVQLWAAVLGAVPDATLFLKARALGDDATAQAVRQRFANAGVDPGRLRLAGWAADDTHLGLYADVDIALDTWPYNGATTTCQALWMGVPVVSLTGPTHAARMGLSILNAVGLSELVTANQDEYVKRCVELASAPARLQALRAGLRERMAASPLMDGVAFTVGLERHYRRAWAETAPGLAQAAGQVERSGVLA